MGIPLPVDLRGRAPGGEAPAADPVAALDGLLGLESNRRGELVEITGEFSSGRTALACRLAAAATARGELAAWVDLPDALDPRSLRRAGADLRALLWVRPPRVPIALRAAELLAKAGFAALVLDLSGAAPGELARLGPAVWTRLSRTLRRCRTTALLLADERLAGSFAARALYTERCRARFEDGLFEGFDVRARVVRAREGPVGAACDARVHHRP